MAAPGVNKVEIERRKKDMCPENVEALEELLEVVRRQREEEAENRTYTWLEDCNVSLWKFRDKHPGIMRGLEEELEPEVWLDVAPRLGLTYLQIERCRTSDIHSSSARKMFNTLAVSPKHRDLTLKVVLEVLLELERHDILRRLQGLDCLKMTEEYHQSKTFTLSIQRLPEVLVAAENAGTTTTTATTATTTTTTEDVREVVGKISPPPPPPAAAAPGPPPPPPPPPQKTQSYLRVLIVHASDATESALRLAGYLRNPPSGQRLNVLLLQETDNTTVKSWLEIDPWNSIHKWLLMMDVVVPVLSPQFLRQIQNLDSEPSRDREQAYNRYVYRMLLDQYVDMGCKNYFCRAVSPAVHWSKVNENKLVRSSGLFQMHWNCSSEEQLEEYISVLCSGAKTARKMKKLRR